MYVYFFPEKSPGELLLGAKAGMHGDGVGGLGMDGDGGEGGGWGRGVL